MDINTINDKDSLEVYMKSVHGIDIDKRRKFDDLLAEAKAADGKKLMSTQPNNAAKEKPMFLKNPITKHHFHYTEMLAKQDDPRLVPCDENGKEL